LTDNTPEGGALPCSGPTRCALRAIFDVLPRHRPAARLSPPWIPTRSAAHSSEKGCGRLSAGRRPVDAKVPLVDLWNITHRSRRH
jgi:hypothetical protein